jgi:TetR/AcrR family tetracycline transcriptional repressor
MLSYRDGARVFAGTDIDDPLLFQTTEIALRTLCDAGFTARQAARGIPVVLHYTVGFTIEEQARTSVDYGADNPYQNGSITDRIDRDRYPLTARAWDSGDLFADDPDESFADGLRTVIAGIDVVVFGR